VISCYFPPEHSSVRTENSVSVLYKAAFMFFSTFLSYCIGVLFKMISLFWSALNFMSKVSRPQVSSFWSYPPLFFGSINHFNFFDELWTKEEKLVLSLLCGCLRPCFLSLAHSPAWFVCVYQHLSVFTDIVIFFIGFF